MQKATLNRQLIKNSSKVITLGPKGTFSNLAASRVNSREEIEIEYTKTIPQITQKVVEDPNSIGVLPIENSIAGSVRQAQDSLIDAKVVILKEVSIPISYSLLAHGPLNEVKWLISFPLSFEQTAKFTSKKMPEIELIYSDSNIHSGEIFLEKNDPAYAAIVPKMAAKQSPAYSPFIQADDIQDYSNNTTRFLVIKKLPEKYELDYTLEKATLFVSLNEDRHSLLFEILREFHVYGINLSRLESHPSKENPWVYNFFIDFKNSHRTEALLENLKKIPALECQLLGSYNSLPDNHSI